MKRFTNIILTLTLITFMMSGCGNKVDKSLYISTAQELSQNIYDESILLGNYVKYLANYWNTINSFNSNAPGIKTDFDAETAIKYANDWIAENSDKTRDDMDKAYENIKSKYNEIEALKIDGSLAEIHDSVNSLYDAYCKLYITGTNPSNSVNEYRNSTQENLQNISDEYDKLTQLFNENGADANGKEE